MSSVTAIEATAPDRVATVGRGGDLTLPGGVLRDLRLLRSEPFLVFSEGRQFIHVIRADAGPAALLKAERISLHGSIESFGIADLFSLINMSRRNGLLLLIADPVQKSVYFRRGEIVFAGSNLPEDRLGQVLYRTVEDIVRATGWGEFNTFKVLYKLLKAGLVEVQNEPAPRPAKEDTDAGLLALVEAYNRAFLLLRDVLRAKAVEVDLGRVFEVFLRNASDSTRAVFHGVVLGASRRPTAGAGSLSRP